MTNSAVVSEREICSGRIEGVDFGPRVWVIARSPTAMLLWIFGQSYWSGRGQQGYASPHLTLLPDRTPRFMYHPEYRDIKIEGVRLKPELLSADQRVLIGGALGIGIGQGALLDQAIRERKTLVVEGGGGRLMPYFKNIGDVIEWKRAGHRPQFITLPEGVTEWDVSKHKLGWRPKP